MGKGIINYDAATTNELLNYVKEIKDGGGINLDAPKDGNLYGQQDGEWKQAQEKLVDGESIKTLNGVSVLGSGNIDVAPTIGDNGNWYINGEDTGKPSKGTDGKNGADGVSLGEIALVQETGTENGSENKVMSQKAISTELIKRTTELNISALYPTSGIDGSNRYDLAGAIAQVPTQYRTIAGLKITFISNETSKSETWVYNGNGFTTTTNWTQGSGSGGNKILEWNTDVATTRKQVLSQERKKLLQISYENENGDIINEQYIGTTFTDTEWVKDENWEQIPNKDMLVDLDRNLQILRSIELYKEEDLSHNGTTKIYIPIMKDKAYQFLSNEGLSFTIGTTSFRLESNVPYIFNATEDSDTFTYVKYGVLEYLIVSELVTTKSASLYSSNILPSLNKIIIGQEPIYNRNPIQITPTSTEQVRLPIPGSGTQAALLEVSEGDEFIITSDKFSDLYKPYSFLDERYRPIEGAYATGVLDNETIIAPSGAKYIALNNYNATNYSFKPHNKGYSSLKGNVEENNEQLKTHEQLLYYKEYAYNDTIQGIGSNYIRNISLIKGKTYRVLMSSGTSTFKLGGSDGENLGPIEANIEKIITPDENYNTIYFTSYNADIKVEIYQFFNVQEQIKQIKSYISLKSKYPSFSILSDSYSTFKDYLTPETNDTYYPADNVDSVEKTWWGLLAKEQGMMLMQNNSYSGTYVCNSEKANETLQQNSFIRRMSNLERASVIFLFGGTNDSWNNVDLGEFKYSDWTEEELKTFRPAFAYMLDFIKKKHFGSKIVVIKNPPVSNGTGFTEEISVSIDEICLHYSIDTLSPSISKASNWHPNEAGMRSIYETIVDYLQNN